MSWKSHEGTASVGNGPNHSSMNSPTTSSWGAPKKPSSSLNEKQEYQLYQELKKKFDKSPITSHKPANPWAKPAK